MTDARPGETQQHARARHRRWLIDYYSLFCRPRDEISDAERRRRRLMWKAIRTYRVLKKHERRCRMSG